MTATPSAGSDRRGGAAPPTWVPPADELVPAPVSALAGGRAVRPVWRNTSGGVTFQIGRGSGRRFVKWAPAGSGVDLGAEADRLRWAAPFTAVPAVLGQGADAAGTWLCTAGLPGDNAASQRWRAEPGTAVAAIGRGLRHLHDVLPVDACPFSWSVGDRLAAAGRDVLDGRGGDVPVRLGDAPQVDRLVVCHGDACVPNTLVDDAGGWCGHVDLGALGVADRWADLAVTLWSVRFNYGPGLAGVLLDAYGVEDDPARAGFYELLYRVCP